MSHLLPVSRRMQRLIDGINRVMREQLSGIRVIRAFAREPFRARRFAEVNRALSQTALEAGRWQALLLPVNYVGDQPVQRRADLVRRAASRCRPDAGGVADSVPVVLPADLRAVLMATFILMMVPRASVCAERISEVLSTDAAIISPQPQPVRPRAVNGVVRLHRVTFCYPGADRAVLQDVSLTARPGTTTAIVGSTGSGKSTLVSLICRLCEVTDGSVTVDGVDVRDYDTRAAVVGDRAGSAARISVFGHRRRKPAVRKR